MLTVHVGDTPDGNKEIITTYRCGDKDKGTVWYASNVLDMATWEGLTKAELLQIVNEHLIGIDAVVIHPCD